MDANTKAAAVQMSPAPNSAKPGNTSSQQKYVLLYDWWLMRTDKEYGGRRLAVGGFTRRRDAVRIFNSMPIVKRHDAFTLEAANGIFLKIEGCINKTRTIGNKFPFESCSAFFFGFPAAWEFFAYEYSVNKASHQLIQENKPENFDSSSQPQTVMLRDWWLSKTERCDEGNQLSVGGLTKWGKATRLFNSAPIIKRHNAYTLETADGMTIRLQGFIDQTRTVNNGFTPEVCRYFLVGFPITWASFVSTGTKWSKCSPDKVAFELPSLDDPPSTPSASLTDSIALLRKAIHTFKCSNVPPQDAETNSSKIRSTSYVDKDSECPKSDHKTHVNFLGDRVSLENSIDHGKLDFTHDAMFRNSNKCGGQRLIEGQVGVSWNSIVEKDAVKEEVTRSKPHKFDGSSTQRLSKLRSGLSKLKNLSQKFPNSPNKPIRRSKRFMASSVVDEDCQRCFDFDCLSTDVFITTDMRQPDHNSAKGSSPYDKITHLSEETDMFVEDNPTNTKSICSQTSEKRMTRVKGKKKDIQTGESRMKVKHIGSRSSSYFTRSKSSKPSGSVDEKEKDVEVSGDIEQSEDRASRRTGHKTVWVSTYNVCRTPSTRSKEKKLSFLTPEALNLKRSRSGRVLVPQLDCSMRIIYDADGYIAGTAPVETPATTCKGSQAKRQRTPSTR